MPSKVFQVSCDACEARFNTTHALKKHWTAKHSKRRFPRNLTFYRNEDCEVILHKAKRMPKHSVGYRFYCSWLRSVTERINNAHHPKSRAKWNKIEILHVPMEFFQEFLSDLGKPEPNSVKDMHHWRPPMMQASVLRVSYKIYDKPSFERVLGVSGLNLKSNEKWSGQEVISSTPAVDEITTAQDAIRVAMSRRQQKKVTTSSQITIHEGKKTIKRTRDGVLDTELDGEAEHGGFGANGVLGGVLDGVLDTELDGEAEHGGFGANGVLGGVLDGVLDTELDGEAEHGGFGANGVLGGVLDGVLDTELDGEAEHGGFGANGVLGGVLDGVLDTELD
ncbi:hypothetical protein QZH41_012083, partial [Actinostola sp. cb2023]